MRSTVIFAVIAIAPALLAAPPVLQSHGEVRFIGEVEHPEQLSGVTFYHELLVVCPDEAASFNVLKRVDGEKYRVTSTIQLMSGDGIEIDLEAATSDARHLYLVGSHSLARKKVDADRKYKKNRERITEVDEHEGADSLFRLVLDDEGRLKDKDRISLRDIFKSDDILKAFTKIPSKENGIDIEGLAVKDGRLYLGFRGPVLRENFVPIVVLDFDDPEDYEMRFVNLDGRGIRDITAVDDGFLIIGGPVGDGFETCVVYYWDGKDCIPGDGSPGGTVTALGTIPSSASEKPEGIVVTSTSSEAWEVIVVFDGKQAATRFKVARP